MLLLLKENEFECDPHSKDDKLEVADNICYESCEVASEQFIGSTAPVKKGDQGTRIVPGNVPYLENISMASETCPSAKNTPTWKMCKTIVSTIAEKVKDGLEVQAILLFIKEKILHEFRLDDLDQPIQQITKIICHAKGINEERVFENIQAHKIQNRIDAIIIPLIMAIELASIECGETIPILNATMHGIGTDQQGLPEQEQNLSFEEENAMTIQFQQELSANTEVPVFSAKKENIIAQHFSTTSKEPKVSQICSSESYNQQISDLFQLVNVIIQEVHEGNNVIDIVVLVTEQIHVGKNIDEMENAISMLTSNICNAKGVKIEELLETLDQEKLQTNSDQSTVLALIAAIELTSIQYDEISPLMSGLTLDSTTGYGVTKQSGIVDIEEDSSISVSVLPHILDHDILPEFQKDAKKIRPSRLSLDRNEIQVWRNFGLFS
jgi:hypothetical protein